MGFQNFYSSKISNDIGAGDVTITVDNAPTSTSGRMTLEARNSTQREIIKYTGLAGNVLTGVTRGQGGTTAKAHLKGALIQQNATGEDLQDLYDAFASFAASANDWRTLVPACTAVTALGNRSYRLTFASTVAAVLSNGMRLCTTRTVPAPTQCTSLNGTTQYYSKSSPAGMTFTDDFTVSAWIKVNAYSGEVIASRYNGTSGWDFILNSSGQVKLSGYNASASNFSQVLSYQSVPLNKWVHVTAQLDMSTFTATPTTSYVMIDGVDVPASVSRGGTNPTALIQAGNLEIGSEVGGTGLFNGKLAQVAIYNAKVTQATMRGYISQGLAGTETSLISAYSFNNTINDLNTTNANNLTPNGSAVATNADSFAGGQADGTISSILDYAIVTTVAGTIVTVQVPEGCTIPTTGGVGAVSYSGVKAPYGMPTSKNKWRLSSLLRVSSGTTSNATYGAFQSAGWALFAPIGEWDIGWGAGYVYNASTTAVTFNMSSTALTGLTLVTGNNASPYSRAVGSPSAAFLTTNIPPASKPQSITSAVTYVMYSLGATTSAAIEGQQADTELFAEFNLL